MTTATKTMKLFRSSGVYIDGNRADVSPVDKQWANGGLSARKKGEALKGHPDARGVRLGI
mgnify:CR=1 FL=1